MPAHHRQLSAGHPGVSIAAVTGKAGSRFYTVNDRPVAVVPTADGGADCEVLDFATGEMVPDRSYFAHVTPGSGKDVDVLSEAEFGTRLAECRAEAGARAVAQVRQWAQQLCTAAGTSADVTAALGLSGAPPFRGTVTVDPPPPGYLGIAVTAVPGGKASATLRPAGRLLTREILDAGFGAGRELPIFPDSGDEGHVWYRIPVPGAQAQCTVSVRFRRGSAAVLSVRQDG
jgi:hypothetical protein